MAAERNPAWAVPVDLPHVENFHRVTPDLYRSAQPDAEAMRELEAFGIKTIINLRETDSDPKPAQGTGLILRRVPMYTGKIKEDEIIAVMRMLKTEEKPILVHCRHGADRTGLVMALYRMLDQGWTREEALAELKKGGYGHHRIWFNIPRYLRDVDLEVLRRKIGITLYPQRGSKQLLPSGVQPAE